MRNNFQFPMCVWVVARLPKKTKINVFWKKKFFTLGTSPSETLHSKKFNTYEAKWTFFRVSAYCAYEEYRATRITNYTHIFHYWLYYFSIFPALWFRCEPSLMLLFSKQFFTNSIKLLSFLTTIFQSRSLESLFLVRSL